MNKYEYKGYICSEAWRLKKEEFKKTKAFRSGRCFVCCNQGIEIHIHHLTYKRLGREKMKDLRVLCAICHAASHTEGSSKKMRAKWYPHASRNKLWSLRSNPKEYANEVAKFFKVENHPFSVRVFS